MATALKRTAGGGGGSQTLAQVLATGNDANATDMTNVGTVYASSLDISSGGTIVLDVGDIETGGGGIDTTGDTNGAVQCGDLSATLDAQIVIYDANATEVLSITNDGDGGALVNLNPTSVGGALAISGYNSAGNRITVTNDGKLGFFAAPAVVQPTGVAVTAEAIHAALVNLGLITA